ncbi:MAG: flagellar biosynthesis protein FlgI [Candidatus Marinimicrobia bacterium]|nr:flagellar biosynthesis protein FlgI [Candidatus Neomarinimicrobiota bacterium]|tara:strand:+ start:8224 stop:9354 length:1131 start_codon:yes stop_codon:yes gene_type:complete
MNKVKKYIIFLIISSFIQSEVRLKDIVQVEKENAKSLIGYGLVIGLGGTGDRSTGMRGAIFTVQTISNMLERFGITIPKKELRTRNVAAVMVTGETPPYGRVGTSFDVIISSMGDATSIEGGVLLMTPLMSSEGIKWGMAQGPVSVGGYNIETEAGERLRKNHSQVGRIPGGGQLTSEITSQGISVDQPLRLSLNSPDYTTATKISNKINSMLGVDNQNKLAIPINAALVEVSYPDFVTSQGDISFFIAAIETLMVATDIEARVVINERTGTVVAGGNVVIDEVMISHGDLTIHTRSKPVISQPSPFSEEGETVSERITKTSAEEMEAKTGVIPTTASVNDLAIALNEMGLKPRDIIAIFQAVKQAGALNAKLIIM